MTVIRLSGSVGVGGRNLDVDIKTVQKALNQMLNKLRNVKRLVEDGKLGAKPEKSKTVAAIESFQKDVVGMIIPDGRIDVNGKSHRKLGEQYQISSSKQYRLPSTGVQEELVASDFESIAKKLNCEVAAIKAVAEVESRGKAFLESGKPKILFEAHIFSRLTKHAYDISNPTISSRNWNRSLYNGGEAEYRRLEQAIKLCAHSAIQSASWGRFQIMGFNHKMSGFSSVEAFVFAMFSSEKMQLEAFASFVEKSGLTKYIQNKNWAAFAKGYNGSSYKENNYDTKLEKAYKKYTSVTTSV